MKKTTPILVISILGLSLISCNNGQQILSSSSVTSDCSNESSASVTSILTSFDVTSSDEETTSESSPSESISSSELPSTLSSEDSISEESSLESSLSEISFESEETFLIESEESSLESSFESVSDSMEESSSESSSEERQIDIIETFAKRMPAEFEPVSMIKMCYPCNMPIDVYKTIAQDNKLLVLVNPNGRNKTSRISQAETEFQNAGVNLDNVTFIDMDIDDDYTYWIRDFSPFYVFDGLDLSVVDFTYNRPFRRNQNNVPSRLATYFEMGYEKMNIVHTGGNLMQDGRGTAFSDDLVITENNDDANLVCSEMESLTGTDRYFITIDPQGDYIAHIDCWAKIVAPDKIIVARLPETNPRYSYYEQVAEELGSLECAYGYPYRIYRVDEPGGDIVAPYTNSLIANGHVYMPLGENASYNEAALAVYQQALPGYEVIGVEGFSFDDAEMCFLNTDALHCRTHEIPDQNMLFIDSRNVYHGEVAYQDDYLVQANIVSYAGGEVAEEDVKIHYSINDASYVEANMERYGESSNFIYTFEGLSEGDDVKYYIEATDSYSNSSCDPTFTEFDPHHFIVAESPR